jgi:hypothetical protein
MKPKPEKWSVVVAGAWNIRLFTPGWVGKNILHGIDPGQMTIEMPVGPIVVGLRYSSTTLVVLPQDERIVIGVREPSVEQLALAELAAVQVLTLLPHTPVSAIGINVGYAAVEPSEELKTLFTLSDLTALASQRVTAGPITIKRQLDLEGDMRLNLSLSLVDGVAHADLNFHQDVADADVARRELKGKVRTCLEFGRELLSAVYGMDPVDSEEDHEHESA